MSHNRRRLLKTIGAAGAGTLITAGAATADENDCVEVLETVSFEEACLEEWAIQDQETPKCGPPFVPQGVLAGVTAPGYITETYKIPEETFQDSDFDTNRLSVEINFGSPGPDAVKYSQIHQRSFGDWEIVSNTAGETATTHEHKLVTGDGTDVVRGGTAIIDAGVEFRILVRTQDVPVTEFEATLEVQTYDPKC